MEYMDYLDNYSPNIQEFSFPYRYNKFLLHLYFDFNKEFNIIIDDCENERMKKEDIPKALEMAIAFKEEMAMKKDYYMHQKFLLDCDYKEVSLPDSSNLKNDLIQDFTESINLFDTDKEIRMNMTLVS
ncbi:hypothetical protein [Treponema sp.]|uniref:hypothetical protein n=1 Tax=Treponema sp. TaxID=166 RepID=UPI0025FB56BA|nr:hypothetical protein [Treponema sp.]MCR5217041.1 hypothetical protein [Treponema sp.]